MNFIELAFEEALKAVGVSYPNPAVGAIVVKDGRIVGRGHTQVVHGPHAEVMAIRDSGDAARGGTLYVTLEPCCHFGRTPPCTDAIIAAGIRQVFFAHSDPNPLVCGKSGRILATAGVVSLPIGVPDEFSLYYEGYDYFVRTGRPFVHLKIAESADGFIAFADRNPCRITGEESDRWVARFRSTAEAILVGGGTALADDPRLTVRGVSGNNPRRIVLAGARALPPSLKLFADKLRKKTIVYSRVPQPALQNAADVRILSSEDFAENWEKILGDLSLAGVHRLAVEPGATLSRLILKSGLWNRLSVLRSSRQMIRGLSWRTGIEPELPAEKKLGDDMLLSALNGSFQ